MALIDCGNGVRQERGLKCPLSDGTVLVSDHYYPAGSGPWPTLLMRQPYGRDIASTVVYAHPIWFARHGFHVAIQDVRGRGGSTGDFYPFRHEARDGAESICWLQSHGACNGRIGMYGFSYQGATQLLAAAEQPEGLECIAPHMTAADLYHGWFYHQAPCGWVPRSAGGFRCYARMHGARNCETPVTGSKKHREVFARNLRLFLIASIPRSPIRNFRNTCEIGFRTVSPAITGVSKTSANALNESRFPHCTSPDGTTQPRRIDRGLFRVAGAWQ